MAWLLCSILVFVALSGLMSAIEAAVLSVTQPEIDELMVHGRPGAQRLWELKRELPRSLAVIVILTNLINVLGPILVSLQAFRIYGPGALVPITIVLTFGTIVFSEVIPKSLGSHYAPRLARWSAPAIWIMSLATYPLGAGLAWLSGKVTRGRRPIGTETQIRALVKLGREAGHIEPEEGRMIYRSFLLNDRTAYDIMTPLIETVSIPATVTVGEAVDVVLAKEFSRFPVFGKSPDDVRGWVLARDLLTALTDGQAETPVSLVLRPPFVVDADAHADELLVRFRARREHLAVVQRAGRTVGIVTLEDVLEEIVGEIEDEKDIASR